MSSSYNPSISYGSSSGGSPPNNYTGRTPYGNVTVTQGNSSTVVNYGGYTASNSSDPRAGYSGGYTRS
ncbi:unnamed protein product [Clonostachys byssicola]|uniref:Uncharacterized protein n=1 Tax=Clonostachys byssicola TaxID=160290 RepID=A0A9N9Y4V9_9HYPO|nr:unnamed protein product [Clonostachys byssicola]